MKKGTVRDRRESPFFYPFRPSERRFPHPSNA